MDQPQIKTGKAVTMIQLLISVGTIIVAIAIAFANSQVRLAQFNDRITYLENQVQKMDSYRASDGQTNQVFDQRLDALRDQLTILETQFNDLKQK